VKEPVGHGPYEEGPLHGHCAYDDEEWPCAKWRKWTASPEFRLGEVEQKLAANEKRASTARKELRETKEKLRRLELLVRGGVLLHLRDSGADISEKVDVDYHEYNTAGGMVFRAAGAQEYTVEYTGKNARYVNGRMEESWG
jgi:hypothetical protein